MASRRTFQSLSRWCAVIAVLLGLACFAGWISGFPMLASVRAKYIPMAPSTALCFTLLGCGLVIHGWWPSQRWFVRLCSLVPIIMALAKLIEFAGGYQFGIDAWFVRHPGR